MKLKSLRPRNFKGIKEFTLEPDGKDVNVFGANEAGKTTLFDAFTWVLFGKDSLERNDFGIKPQGASGIESEVEVDITLPTGGACLKKVYQEKWTKKRGQPKAELTGHTTDHFINGVPQKEGEYKAYIKSLIDEELFKLLTNPRHFNEVLEWKKRREMLMSMCGISGEEMKAIDNKLKVIKADRAKLNKALEQIPTRIDEVNKGLPEVPDHIIGTNFLDINFKGQLKTLQEQRASLSTSGQVAKILPKMAEVDKQLFQIKNQQTEKIQRQINDTRQTLSGIKIEIEDTELAVSHKRRAIQVILEEAKALEETQKGLRTKYKELSSCIYTVDDECPIGRGKCLQIDDIDEAGLSTFNLKKSKDMEAINTQGKANKHRLEELENQESELTKEINILNINLADLEGKTQAPQAKIESLNALLRQVESMPEYLEVLTKRKSLEADLVKAQTTIDTTEIDQQIKDLEAQIAEQEATQAGIKEREKGLKRIEELKAEEKKLSEQFEQIEKDHFGAENQLRETVSALEEQINCRFEYVSFRLFNELINGGIEDCCEAMSKAGVAYKDMSNSQRIRAGLDIIRTLSKHHGIECPVFIDNAESCDHLIDMGDIQLISLIVSGQDKKLRVEQIKEQGVLV